MVSFIKQSGHIQENERLSNHSCAYFSTTFYDSHKSEHGDLAVIFILCIMNSTSSADLL